MSSLPPNNAPNPTAILGRTGLRVGRIVLSAGYGIGPEGIEMALARGQNLFYWGSLRRRKFGDELARQIRLGRDRVSIALQSYSRSAALLRRSVESGLRRLGTDRVQLLILGFWQSLPPPRIIEAALRLRDQGLVAHLGFSTHSLTFARTAAAIPWVDFLMIRHNAADRADAGFLDHLPDADRPGIIAFTATRWGGLLNPALASPGERPLTATDCYRFCLSHPRVDAVLCGPRSARECEASLAALDAPAPDAAELASMAAVGDRLASRPAPLYNFGSDTPRGSG